MNKIISFMHYEKATVKKAVKKYKTVKQGVKESISVNINLGSKSVLVMVMML